MNITFGLKEEARGKTKELGSHAYDGGVSGRANNGEWAIEVEGRSVDSACRGEGGADRWTGGR